MHFLTCHEKYDFISAFYEHIICLFHTWKQYILYLIEAFCFKDCNKVFLIMSFPHVFYKGIYDVLLLVVVWPDVVWLQRLLPAASEGLHSVQADHVVNFFTAFKKNQKNNRFFWGGGWTHMIRLRESPPFCIRSQVNECIPDFIMSG